MIKIILKGEPKSTQSIYKTACRGGFPSLYMSAQGKAIKEDYYYQTKNQYKRKPLTKNLGVSYDIYFGTKRKCDLDNFNKLVGDALNGIVWEDDSQIYELNIRKFYDKENPRVEIFVDEL